MSAREAMSTGKRERYHGPAALSRVVGTYFERPTYLKLSATATSVHDATIHREDLTKYREYLWELYQLGNTFSITRPDWKKCLSMVWEEKRNGRNASQH